MAISMWAPSASQSLALAGGAALLGATLASCVDDRKPVVGWVDGFGSRNPAVGAAGGPAVTQEVAVPGASGPSSGAMGSGQLGNGKPAASAGGSAQGGLPGSGAPGSGGQGGTSAPSGSASTPGAGGMLEEPGPPGPELPPASVATLLWSVGAEGTGPGQFDDARFVGVDTAGSIYVAEFEDEGPTRVQRFNAQGGFVNQWLMADEAIVTGMVVDGNGLLYALKFSNMTRYDGPSGTFLGPFTLPIVANTVGGLARAPDEGLLLLSASQILRLDPAGQVTLAVEDTLEAALDDSNSINNASMDAVGNVYVTASFQPTVYKFNPAGAFETRIGTEGTGVGVFDSFPRAVAVDRRGRVYAADFDGIEVFEPGGGSRGQIPATGSVFSLIVSAQDELIVLDRNAATLSKYALAP